MNTEYRVDNKPAPAGGQTVRLPGSARSVSLHEQLYRYADDLQMMLARNDELRGDNDELRQSADRLLESREELDAIMQASLDIHLVTTAEGVIREANPASASLAPVESLAGSNLADWVEGTHHAGFLALHANVLAGGRGPDSGHELHLRRAEAGRPPLIVTARVLAVRRDGYLRHLHWILRDVTYLRETEFETQIASMVFNNAIEGVMITDVEGGILAVNAAFSRITGYSAAEALGRQPSVLASGHQGPEFYEVFWRSLRTTGSWHGQLFNRRKNGETYPERLTVNSVRDASGRVLSYIAVFSDLSPQATSAEPKMLQLAFRDSLTQVANRDLLEDRLERMVMLSRRSEQPFSLVLVDLDRFGKLNEEHGHLIGDRVLREVAARLSATIRASDTVARVGADNYVLLAPGLVKNADLSRFCEKILCALRSPIEIDELNLAVTASLGVAEFPRHGADATGLMANAAAALGHARSAGGNRFAIYAAGDAPALPA